MTKSGWGGARPGSGRKRKTLAEHRRDRTKPHYTTKPQAAQAAPQVERIFPVGAEWPGRPSPTRVFSAVEEAWSPALDEAWQPEAAHGGRYGPLTPRGAAEDAVADWYRAWRVADGPEWAAARGYAHDRIEAEFRRAPDALDPSYDDPPALADVIVLLADGRLLAWLRGELTLDGTAVDTPEGATRC